MAAFHRLLQATVHKPPERLERSAMTELGRHLITITSRPETVFVEGRGSFLVDERGRRYLDLVKGWAVNSLGHSPALIAQALADQAARLINPSPAFFNRPMAALS